MSRYILPLMTRVVLALTLLVGCSLDRAAFGGTEADVGAMTPDAGPDDSAIDAEPAQDAASDGPAPIDVPHVDGCEGRTEECNGDDDDCDGVVDETDPRLGASCTFGVMGTCQGMLVCDGIGLVCRPNEATTNETCNGRDDDCDTRIDEEVAEVGEPCATGGTEMCPGVYVCAEGILSCPPLEPASQETCDGLDEDCDGTVDEDPILPLTCEVTEGCQGRVSECREGAVVCERLIELCTDSDRDCDGDIDEDVVFCQPCRRFTFEDHDYLFCSKNRKWNEADEWCANQGMELVRVDSPEENAWIIGRANDIQLINGDWWLGLRDVTIDGMTSSDQFRWSPDDISGAVPFLDWDSGEPNGADGCARMKGNRRWADINCDNSYNFICESP